MHLLWYVRDGVTIDSSCSISPVIADLIVQSGSGQDGLSIGLADSMDVLLALYPISHNRQAKNVEIDLYANSTHTETLQNLNTAQRLEKAANSGNVTIDQSGKKMQAQSLNHDEQNEYGALRHV